MNRLADTSVSVSPWVRRWLYGLGVTALFFVANALAYVSRAEGQLVTTLWFPTGLLIGLLLVSPRRRWWALGAVSIGTQVVYALAVLGSGDPWYWALAFASIDTLAAVLGAEIIWLRRRRIAFDTPGDVLWMAGSVAVVLTLASALSATAIVELNPQLSWWSMFAVWWAGDVLSTLAVTPVVLAWLGPSGGMGWTVRRPWGVEALGLFVGLFVVAGGLALLPAGWHATLPMWYLVFPFLMWAALRFDGRVTATALLVLSGVLVLEVGQGVGPFWVLDTGEPASPRQAVLSVQIFLSVLCLGTLVMSAVVNQRHQAEQQLRAQHEQLEVLAKTMRPTLWVMDLPSAELTYLSPPFEALAGRNPGSMLGRPDAWREIVHPDDRAVTETSLSVMRERGWDDNEYRIVRPDGTMRWVRELSSAVRDEDGTIRQLVGSVEDVTHRHRAAEQHRMLVEELRDSNARYQDFMRISGEAVWRAEFNFPVLIDQPYDGFEDDACKSAWIAECNQRFAEMFGAPDPEAIVGRRVTEFFPLRDRSNRVYRDFYEQQCQSITAEVCDNRQPENPRWYLVSFAGVVEDGHLVRIWGTRTETTAQRLLEAQLRESQKMEAVGQLAGGVAHDFNNLLAVISAHAELVQDRVGEVEGVAKSLAVVREAIDHAAGVSRSLMAFSKNLPADKRPTDLRQVVVQTQRLVDRTLPSTVELAVEMPGEGLTPVMGDHVQLQQVLLNLAINARDALPAAGGTIRIAAEDFERQTTDGESAGRWVRMVVQDDGAGMTEEVRRRIFEPFFSTKGPDAGTGLGLSVVRGIVEDHGGTIAVFSRFGQGTTFTLELPCIDDVVMGDHPEADTSAEVMTVPSDLPVLLGEDDPQIRAVIATALVGRGHRVIQAGDGHALREAYDAHTQGGRPFAALVTDIDMPGRTGIDVLRELRREGCATPAVVLTGSIEMTLDPRLDGDTVLVHKPFGVAELCRLVQKRIASAEKPAYDEDV
ncbi:MAG: MASE1 domain-containing protein [Planctomycetota bacterium]